MIVAFVKLRPPDRRLDVHENWERALGAATGEFVKLVCQDDALMPDCVGSQLDLMTLYPNARVAASRRTIIGEDGRVLLRARGLGSLVRARSPRLVTVHELARACARAGTNLLGEPASVLFRREFLSYPLFDRNWHYTMDLDLYFRVLDSGSAVVDQRVVAYFRISAHQLSAKLAGQQARETRDFFANLAQTYPGTLSRVDLGVASVRSFAISLGRKYLYLRQRDRDS